MYHIRDMLIAFLNCFVQSALQEALRANVALEDINRTALVRLKQGLEESGERFPYQIPPKNAKKDFENRSLSPVDWTEM